MKIFPFWHGWGAAFRTLRAVSLLFALPYLASPLWAQSPPASPPAAQAARLAPAELDELLAPIALYPDALLALILPASTVPSDIVVADRFVTGKGDAALIPSQPWDESVKGLTRYPDVLNWMDQNLDWTSSLGEAFVDQPADVMNAIQRLRAEARARGNLVDTPQQKILVQEESIRIVPADPEVIYVPQYDPEVVYVQPYAPALNPLITFGIGFAVGSWLSYDFDWGRRCVYYGRWRGWGWNGGRGAWGGWGNSGSVNVVNITNNNATPWQPSAQARRQVAQRQRNFTGNARIAGANVRAAGQRNNRADLAAVPRPSRLALNGRDAERRGASGNANTLASASGRKPADPRHPGREASSGQENRNLPNSANRTRSDLPPPPSEGAARNQWDSQQRSQQDKTAAENRHPHAPSAAPNVPGQIDRSPNRSAPNASANSRGRHDSSPEQIRSTGHAPAVRPSASDERNPARHSSQPGQPPVRQQAAHPQNSVKPSSHPQRSESRPQAQRPSSPKERTQESAAKPDRQPSAQRPNRPSSQVEKPSRPQPSHGTSPNRSSSGSQGGHHKEKKD